MSSSTFANSLSMAWSSMIFSGWTVSFLYGPMNLARVTKGLSAAFKCALPLKPCGRTAPDDSADDLAEETTDSASLMDEPSMGSEPEYGQGGICKF